MTAQGKSIRIFLVDGQPAGMLTAEIPNWTGHVLAAPRSRLPDLLRRVECQRAGLYLLLGDALDGSEPLAYIGETENIGERLTQHARPAEQGGKDFWHRVFVITSKDTFLTKGHLRFVESRLITQALNARRIALDNVKGTQNEYGLLPEADQADMLYFIEQIRLVLPVLGLDLLREAAVPSRASLPHVRADLDPPRFELRAAREPGLKACAVEIDGEFVVQKGSTARAQWSATQPAGSYRKLHEQLVEHQVLVPVETGAGGGSWLCFTTDYAFSSPSAASAVIFGRNDNGRTSWKRAGSSQTYAQWQDQQLALPAVPGLHTQGHGLDG